MGVQQLVAGVLPLGEGAEARAMKTRPQLLDI
jgi:hypothetical protein